MSDSFELFSVGQNQPPAHVPKREGMVKRLEKHVKANEKTYAIAVLALSIFALIAFSALGFYGGLNLGSVWNGGYATAEIIGVTAGFISFCSIMASSIWLSDIVTLEKSTAKNREFMEGIPEKLNFLKENLKSLKMIYNHYTQPTVGLWYYAAIQYAVEKKMLTSEVGNKLTSLLNLYSMISNCSSCDKDSIQNALQDLQKQWEKFLSGQSDSKEPMPLKNSE